MFDQLFKSPHAVARHMTAPLLQERLRFLTHCAGRGTKLRYLRTTAQCLLPIINSLDLATDASISVAQIETAADGWANRQPPYGNAKHSQAARVMFVSLAKRWLRFLGRLQTPAALPSPDTHLVEEFADYMRRERGLSAATIQSRCFYAAELLDYFSVQQRCFSEVSITDIDAVMAHKGGPGGYSRASLRTYVYALRSFLRFAETRRWCRPGLAAVMMAPRLFKDESLPKGPTWEDVERLLASTEGARPADIRNRAILMLLIIYGLRSGEVVNLRLEDLDWHNEVIRITRSKQRRTQLYPLLHSVGEAILRYLKEVRPRSPHREIFLGLQAPFQPLRRSALWRVVGGRLRQMDVSLEHYGPHALRHAWATRLLAQGSTLQEIGDLLGHASPDTTRIYAKVDLNGLRQVADFQLGGLL